MKENIEFNGISDLMNKLFIWCDTHNIKIIEINTHTGRLMWRKKHRELSEVKEGKR